MNNDETKITIKRLKELKGNTSQEEFAKIIHTSQSTVSKMFNGTPLSAANLIEIAKAYDVSTDWLLGLSDKKNDNTAISTENLTYADVIAVLDELYNRKTIHIGYTSGYFNPSEIYVDDAVLSYLLNARKQIMDAGRDEL